MITNSGFLCVAGVLSLGLLLAGCGSAQNGTPTASADHHNDEQQASFAKLSDADRALAKAQGYCAVTAEPLGSMGPPIKLLVNEQPVFVCCKGCEKKAKSDPEKTLAKVAELKAKMQAETPK
jgi:hypothetical protein